MIEWLLVSGRPVDVVRARLKQAWSGGAMLQLLQPTAKSRESLLLTPESARTRREPRWPDVLSDWVDIYEEPLFPTPVLPVAGEVLSEAGLECLALHADLGHPGGARGGIAWYQKGGVVELEQVGQASVAWQRGQPLSRPSLQGAVSQLASMGRRMASTERDAGLYDRVDAGRAATAEAVLLRALLRLWGDDPPALEELFQQVAGQSGQRLSL